MSCCSNLFAPPPVCASIPLAALRWMRKAQREELLSRPCTLSTSPLAAPLSIFLRRRSRPCSALLGYYVTELAENTFPQLPVREGEHVFVWFASFADEEARDGSQDRKRCWN